MTSPPKTYRVYSYDPAHKALTADVIEAASDEEVIAQAEAAGFGPKCEIWEDRRLVAQLHDQRRPA